MKIFVILSFLLLVTKIACCQIFINPENLTDKHRNGSREHPYANWDEVTWHDNTNYFQKSGTICLLQKSMQIKANNVTLSSYDKGDKPMLISHSKYIIHISDQYNVSIKGFIINGDSMRTASAIYLQTIPP